MKMKSLLGIVLSLSILQSCQNDETNIIQNEVNNKGITFSSIIDEHKIPELTIRRGKPMT